MSGPALAPIVQNEYQPRIREVALSARIVARAIDLLFELASFTVLAIAVVLLSIRSTTGNVEFKAHFAWEDIAGFILLGDILYRTLCQGMQGSTLGKFIMGQVMVTRDHKPLSIDAALIDSLCSLVPWKFFWALTAFNQATKRELVPGQLRFWDQTVVCHRSDLPRTSRRSLWLFIPVFLFAALAQIACFLMAIMFVH